MAANDRKRQKKIERRKAQRKEKKKAIARQESGGLLAKLTSAAMLPILHCWMTYSNEEQGIGYVTLSREGPGGMVGVVCFLIDRYCLGVKDVIVDVIHRADYERRFQSQMRSRQPGRDVPPEDAARYVTEAVAYARSLGLPPHPDYTLGMVLFTGIDPANSKATFEFGQEGKPHFIAGPNDGPVRCRMILAILHNTCGPGGYHFTIPVGDPTLMPDDTEFERLGWDEDDEDDEDK